MNCKLTETVNAYYGPRLKPLVNRRITPFRDYREFIASREALNTMSSSHLKVLVNSANLSANLSGVLLVSAVIISAEFSSFAKRSFVQVSKLKTLPVQTGYSSLPVQTGYLEGVLVQTGDLRQYLHWFLYLKIKVGSAKTFARSLPLRLEKLRRVMMTSYATLLVPNSAGFLSSLKKEEERTDSRLVCSSTHQPVIQLVEGRN